MNNDELRRAVTWPLEKVDWRHEARHPVPIEWMPTHDYTGEGWRKCKWRLPVEDRQ